MPPLKNHRQEMFCQLVKRGIPRFRAYPMAGYKPDTGEPYRLSEKPRVKARIAEITRHIAMKTRITVESITAQMFEDRSFAIEHEQPAAAHAATVSLAKLHGLLIDRKESGGPGEFGSLQTVEQVLGALKEQLGPEIAAALKTAVEASEGLGEATAPTIAPAQQSFGEAEKSIADFRRKKPERRRL